MLELTESRSRKALPASQCQRLANPSGMSGAPKLRLNGSKLDIEPAAGSRSTCAKRSAEAAGAWANVGHLDHPDSGLARRGRDGGRYLDFRLDLVADAIRSGCGR